MSPIWNPNLGSENLELATGIAKTAFAQIGLCVKRTTVPGEFELCGTAGERVDGIIHSIPKGAGKEFTYVVLKPGSVFGQGCAGAAIGSVGANLGVNSAGKLVVTSTATHLVVGRSLSTPGAADLPVVIALEEGLRAIP